MDTIRTSTATASSCTPIISSVATQLLQHHFVSYVRAKRSCFSMKIPVRLSDGVKKMAHVLIDTGAEVNLIRPGFLSKSGLLETPETKMNLLVANKQPLAGGSQACTPSLNFFRENLDPAHTHLNEEFELPIYTYEADIQYNIFIGNPWLYDNEMAPFAHPGYLFMRDPDDPATLAGWVWPSYKAISAVWDGHVANYDPKDLREVVLDKQVVPGTPSVGTKYGDLTPFDLNHFDDPIPYERFLRYVRMERDILGPGHTSFDFVVKRELYPVLWQKFGSDDPNMDVFGASGDPQCDRVLNDPYSADRGPYYSYINTGYEDIHKVIDKIIQEEAKGILVVPAWQYHHWYAALAMTSKASYLIPLRALKMRNHPDVPMRRRHFPHLACLVDGSLIPSVDLVDTALGLYWLQRARCPYPT